MKRRLYPGYWRKVIKLSDHYVMAAKSIVQPAADKAIALIAEAGAVLTVKTDIYLEDGSRNWATTLATLLCNRPELASESRAQTAERLTNELGLSEPFNSNRLSKNLSTEAKGYVIKILAEHGYETSGLNNGTDIKKIIKGNIRTGSARPTTITTKFYADHIEIDGVSFQYRPRERTPMGEAHHDFSIRVAGIDVPLMAVLKLRNIGLAEFKAADSRAVATAEETQQVNRKQLDRDYRPPPGLQRLYDNLQAATRDADKSREKARELYRDIWTERTGPVN